MSRSSRTPQQSPKFFEQNKSNDDALARLGRAHAYLNQRKYELALDILKNLSTASFSETDLVKYKRNLFYCYLEMQQFHQAKQALMSIPDPHQSIQLAIDRLVFLIQTPNGLKGDPEKIKKFNEDLIAQCQQLKLRVESSSLHGPKKSVYLATLYDIENVLLGFTDQSEKMIPRVLNNKDWKYPEARLAQLALISRYMDLSDPRYQQVIDEVKKLKTASNPDAWLLEARLLRDRGDEDKAIQTYQTLVNKFPNYWGGYIEFAYTLSAYYQAYEASDSMCQYVIDANKTCQPSAKPRARDLYHTYKILQHNDTEMKRNGLSDSPHHLEAARCALNVVKKYKEKYDTQVWNGGSKKVLWGVEYQNFNSHNAQPHLAKLAEKSREEKEEKSVHPSAGSRHKNILGSDHSHKSASNLHFLGRRAVPLEEKEKALSSLTQPQVRARKTFG